MPDLFRYSNAFEPLLLEGYTAKLYGAGLPQEGKNVRCVSVGALPEYAADFGALTATVWLTDQIDANLRANNMEFNQIRMRVLDDMYVRLRNSGPVQQWRTRETTFFLPPFPADPDDWLAEFLLKQSEFFVWEYQDPVFECYSSIAAASSKILFSGWRIKVEDIKEEAKFHIWLSDWPARTP